MLVSIMKVLILVQVHPIRCRCRRRIASGKQKPVNHLAKFKKLCMILETSTMNRPSSRMHQAISTENPVIWYHFHFASSIVMIANDNNSNNNTVKVYLKTIWSNTFVSEGSQNRFFLSSNVCNTLLGQCLFPLHSCAGFTLDRHLPKMLY